MRRIYRDLGADYVDKIIPGITPAVREAIAGFTAQEAYSTSARRCRRRYGCPSGYDRSSSSVKTSGAPPVHRRQVMLRKIQLPDKVKNAIEAKLEAAQQAEQMQFVLDKSARKQNASGSRRGRRTFQAIVSPEHQHDLLQWKGIEATENLSKGRMPDRYHWICRNGLPVILNADKIRAARRRAIMAPLGMRPAPRIPLRCASACPPSRACLPCWPASSARRAATRARSTSCRPTEIQTARRHRLRGRRRACAADHRGGAGRPAVRVRSVSDRTFLLHLGGKISVENRMSLKTRDDLSMAYTPGVARAWRSAEPAAWSDDQGSTVAIVSDGCRLGLGDIGGGRHAGHGRQGDALQGIRHQRVPHLSP
jgi:hypothetical protein